MGTGNVPSKSQIMSKYKLRLLLNWISKGTIIKGHQNTRSVDL
jgi:hypothetical protein